MIGFKSPSKTTHKDTGTKVNTSYYFISLYSVNTPNFLSAKTAFGFRVANGAETWYDKVSRDLTKLRRRRRGERQKSRRFN